MKKVLYRKKDRIAYITLNRPEALNVLDDDLNEALWQIWSEFVIGRPLRLEAINGYSSLGGFGEVKERLAWF